MATTRISYKNRLKKGGIILVFLVLVVFLIIVALWQVVKQDHAYVIQKLEESALRNYNAHLSLAGYSVDLIKPFPLIKLQVRNLQLAHKDFSNKPTIAFKTLDSTFDAWDLITGNFNAHPIQVDSLWIHLLTDSEGKSNGSFSKNKSGSSNLKLDIGDLPNIRAQFLDFNREDFQKNEIQHATFAPLTITNKKNGAGRWISSLSADTYFDQLTFKAKDGPFLKDSQGQLEVDFSVDKKSKALMWSNGKLKTKGQEFDLSGLLIFDRKKIIELGITTEGVILSKVLPILSDEINRSLRGIDIDRPIKAKFTLRNILDPTIKGAANLSFETDFARIKYDKVFLTNSQLKGTFSNDCDQDGIGTEGMGCVNVEYLEGNFLGVIPSEVHGAITELSRPKLKASGHALVELEKMNKFLSDKDKFTFHTGLADVQFNYEGNLKNVLNSPFDEQNIKMNGEVSLSNISFFTPNQINSAPVLSGKLSFDDRETSIDSLQMQWMGSEISAHGTLNNLPEFLFYDDEALVTHLHLNINEIDFNDFSQNKSKKTTPTLKDFKKIDHIAKKVASNLNGDIKLGIGKVTVDSFFLSNISTEIKLRSPKKAAYADTTMISVDQFQANFMNLAPVIFDIKLSQGLNPKLLVDAEIPSAVAPLNYFISKKYKIENGDLNIDLATKVPLKSLFETEQLFKDINFEGNITMDQIDVKMVNLEWPLKTLDGAIHFDKDLIEFDQLIFNYRRSPFQLDGDIKRYGSLISGDKAKAKFDLHLKGDFFDFRKSDKPKQASEHPTTSISPKKLFQSLDTIYHYGNGQIDLNVDKVITDSEIIQPLYIQAHLLENKNEYKLQVDSFNFGFSSKDYIKGSATIDNLASPKIDASFLARLRFQKLGDILSSEYIEFKDGFFKLDFDYSSPLFDTLSAENYILKSNIDGKAEISNGEVFYNYRDFTFDDINSTFKFDQRAIEIDDLKFTINGNKVLAYGTSSDFFPFFILPDQFVSIDLNIKSPRFDFGNFSTPDLIERTEEEFTIAPTIHNSSDIEEQSLLTKIGYIDQLLDRGALTLNTDINEIVYKKFTAKNISGLIQMQSDTVRLEELKMRVAEGSFKMNGLISEVVNHRPKVSFELDVRNNNLQELFRQFDNFGSTTFKHEKFDGIATAKVNFYAQVNPDYSFKKETLNGDLDLQLRHGEMREFAFLKNLKGFIFNKRKLQKLVIDTLNLNAHLRGSEVYFDEFLFHSSSFDFYARGKYSLDSIQNTELIISAPLGNLFRRYIPETQLGKKNALRKGPPINIKGFYKNDRFKFRWKLFYSRKSEYLILKE